MKSRTSFFNKTVFKKDLTRFAPAWGVCLILMLLALISMADRSFAYYRLQNVRDSITIMSWLNLIYAAVVAQMLFGDLFTSRMCNALHALPLRRECWFGTHVVSGLAYSLLPNLVIALIALPIMRLESGWVSVFWWLLASELQYLFFFGTAVLCVMLSGNRLGQLALHRPQGGYGPCHRHAGSARRTRCAPACHDALSRNQDLCRYCMGLPQRLHGL